MEKKSRIYLFIIIIIIIFFFFLKKKINKLFKIFSIVIYIIKKNFG